MQVYSSYNLPQKSPNINSNTTGDLPFFCLMESKIHKRSSIWIKLRAGNDASYMKMLQSSSK